MIKIMIFAVFFLAATVAAQVPTVKETQQVSKTWEKKFAIQPGSVAGELTIKVAVVVTENGGPIPPGKDWDVNSVHISLSTGPAAGTSLEVERMELPATSAAPAPGTPTHRTTLRLRSVADASTHTLVLRNWSVPSGYKVTISNEGLIPIEAEVPAERLNLDRLEALVLAAEMLLATTEAWGVPDELSSEELECWFETNAPRLHRLVRGGVPALLRPAEAK